MKNKKLKTKVHLITSSIITIFAITACQVSDNEFIENKEMGSNQISEEQQRQKDENLKAEQEWEERTTTTKIFTDGYNYYNGNKGKIQNFRKAEELLMSAAERGAPFAPHYLVELLVQKYDKLKPAEQTQDHIKECYFWLLIAMNHSSQQKNELYCYSCYIGDASHALSYKVELEKRLSAIEIQEIQDKATIWWETKFEN